MKTRTNIFIVVIVLAGLLPFLSSCSKDWDWMGSDQESDGFVAPVLSLNPPANILAGQPSIFSVDYYKPQPCYTRTGINTSLRGFQMGLEVLLKRDHSDPCADVIVGESAEFTVVFPYPGEYQINFLGSEGLDSLMVMVQ